MEEKDFIARLVQKDKQAFEYLVRIYQDKVFNLCLNFLKDGGEAEDIGQEVFIEVYRSIHKFRGHSKLSTWIYKLATSKSLEYLRYKSREKRSAFFNTVSSEESKEFIERHAVNLNHPGIKLENKERLELLFAAIDQLSENQKTAFVLHNIEGFSYKEIAEIMEKSLSAVESYIFRAKKNLRVLLQNYYKNE